MTANLAPTPKTPPGLSTPEEIRACVAKLEQHAEYYKERAVAFRKRCRFLRARRMAERSVAFFAAADQVRLDLLGEGPVHDV